MSSKSSVAQAVPVPTGGCSTARAGTLSSRWTFLREFLRSPGTVAAVAPSSKGLAKAMIAGADLAGARSIVEFGPGTGTFTRAALDALPADAFTREQHPVRYIAIEYNEPIARVFAERFPGVLLHVDTAERVGEICDGHGCSGSVDCVISGLGWPSFPKPVITRMLEGAEAVLRPGGQFRTFGYHCGLCMPNAWHFRRECRRLFDRVEVSPVVWANLPPAFVYVCTKR